MSSVACRRAHVLFTLFLFVWFVFTPVACRRAHILFTLFGFVWFVFTPVACRRAHVLFTLFVFVWFVFTPVTWRNNTIQYILLTNPIMLPSIATSACILFSTWNACRTMIRSSNMTPICQKLLGKLPELIHHTPYNCLAFNSLYISMIFCFCNKNKNTHESLTYRFQIPTIL
jgi:hypothetical protein